MNDLYRLTRAMSLLKKLLVMKKKTKEEQADKKKSLVGSGDRSERMRTYIFQGRMTDHRVNLTLYKIEQILDEIRDDNRSCQEEHQFGWCRKL